MPIQIHYGGAVSGDQRFARPELEQLFLRHLSSSAGIRMFGLRRIGKSTLRKRAIEEFERAGRPYIFVDGQGLHSMADLLSEIDVPKEGVSGLISKALKFATAPAQAALNALKEGKAIEDAAVRAYWRYVSDGVLQMLKEGERPVLVFDEFSYLLDNMIKQGGLKDIDPLLASMRLWREAGMTMLLTGSLGVMSLARIHGFNHEHLNDLYPFVVPELSSEEARSFLEDATVSPPKGQWTEEHTDAFLEECGALYPAFIVRGLLDVGVQDPPLPTDFATIFTERVRPFLHSEFYKQFSVRFRSYKQIDDGNLHDLILPLLKNVLEASEPVTQENIPVGDGFTSVDLDLALEMLAEDGFLSHVETKDGDRSWLPASRLSLLWWRRAKLA